MSSGHYFFLSKSPHYAIISFSKIVPFMILFLASLPCQHIGFNPVLMGIEQTAPGMGHDPIAVLSSFRIREATTSSFLRQMKDRVCRMPQGRQRGEQISAMSRLGGHGEKMGSCIGMCSWWTVCLRAVDISLLVYSIFPEEWKHWATVTVPSPSNHRHYSTGLSEREEDLTDSSLEGEREAMKSDSTFLKQAKDNVTKSQSPTGSYRKGTSIILQIHVLRCDHRLQFCCYRMGGGRG